jgi:hypothetical protein
VVALHWQTKMEAPACCARSPQTLTQTHRKNEKIHPFTDTDGRVHHAGCTCQISLSLTCFSFIPPRQRGGEEGQGERKTKVLRVLSFLEFSVFFAQRYLGFRVPRKIRNLLPVLHSVFASSSSLLRSASWPKLRSVLLSPFHMYSCQCLNVWVRLDQILPSNAC